MLQTLAASEQIEGDVEHVVGFTVRQPQLKDRTQPVDAVGDAQLSHELLNHSDPAGRDRMRPLGQLILSRRCHKHRRLPVPVGFINPPGNPTLPRLQSISYTLLHLKTSL